jgi:hypothetical protein
VSFPKKPNILHDQRETQGQNQFLTLPRLLTTQYYFISGDAKVLIKFALEGNIPDPQKHLCEH